MGRGDERIRADDDTLNALQQLPRSQDRPTALARRGRIPLPGVDDAQTVPAGSGVWLTPREHDVLHLVAAGRTNTQIASELFISPKTVSVHVSNVLAKLGATSRAEATTIAHRDGLLDPEAILDQRR